MTAPGQAEQVIIRVPSDLRYVEAIRAMLDVLCRRLEAETGTENLSIHVVSAFNEAFNNAVWHGGDGADVEIEVVVAPTQLVLSVVDSGPGFDLDQVVDPDLTQLPEKGLGLLIVRSFMTSVSYERREAKNVLTMTKVFQS